MIRHEYSDVNMDLKTCKKYQMSLNFSEYDEILGFCEIGDERLI
jgi:hypothetical protein